MLLQEAKPLEICISEEAACSTRLKCEMSMKDVYLASPSTSYLPKEEFFRLCRLCMTVMPANEDAYKVHMKKHTKEDRLFKSCPDCSLMVSKKDLSEHRRAHHRSNVLCVPCRRTFADDTRYYLHLVQTHSIDLIHFCKRCDIATKSVKKLKTHIDSKACLNSHLAHSSSKKANPGVIGECLLTFDGGLAPDGEFKENSARSICTAKPDCAKRGLVFPSKNDVGRLSLEQDGGVSRWWSVSCPVDFYPVPYHLYSAHDCAPHRKIFEPTQQHIKEYGEQALEMAQFGYGLKGIPDIASYIFGCHEAKGESPVIAAADSANITFDLTEDVLVIVEEEDPTPTTPATTSEEAPDAIAIDQIRVDAVTSLFALGLSSLKSRIEPVKADADADHHEPSLNSQALGAEAAAPLACVNPGEAVDLQNPTAPAVLEAPTSAAATTSDPANSGAQAPDPLSASPEDALPDPAAPVAQDPTPSADDQEPESSASSATATSTAATPTEQTSPSAPNNSVVTTTKEPMETEAAAPESMESPEEAADDSSANAATVPSTSSSQRAASPAAVHASQHAATAPDTSLKRPASLPVALIPMKQRKLMSDAEISEIRVKAGSVGSAKCRLYTENFCRRGTQFDYTVEQMRETRLYVDVWARQFYPTKCLFCHSRNGLYLPPPDKKEEWINSYVVSQRSIRSQKAVPDFSHYDLLLQENPMLRVCARHFDSSEFDADNNLKDGDALPKFMHRECLVCEEFIPSGLEMPIFYKEQADLLSLVPGCTRTHAEIIEECEHAVQYACPIDVIVAANLFPDALPADIRAPIEEILEIAATVPKNSTSDDATAAEEQDLLRVFNSAQRDAQMEPPHAHVRQHQPSPPAAPVTISCEALVQPVQLPRTTPRQRRKRQKLLAKNQLQQSFLEAQAIANPPNQHQQYPLHPLGTWQPSMSMNPMMQCGMLNQQQMEQQINMQQQFQLQQKQIQAQQRFQQILAMKMQQQQQRQQDATQPLFIQTGERHLAHPNHASKIQMSSQHQQSEANLQSEAVKQYQENLQAYQIMMTQRESLHHQHSIPMHPVGIQSQRFGHPGTIRVIQHTAQQQTPPSEFLLAEIPLPPGSPGCRAPLSPPCSDVSLPSIASAAVPSTELKPFTVSGNLMWTDVPARREFMCRLCVPSHKAAHTPRVRPESNDVEEVLDSLNIVRGTFRRHILKSYWSEDPRSARICTEHVTGGKSAMETGDRCSGCGQHCLTEERSLHNSHHNKELRFCCRDCFIPLEGDELKALKHMVHTHGIEIPTTFRLDCPFKGDKFTPCPHTSFSMEEYGQHIHDRHRYYLPHPLFGEGPNNHKCGLRFKTAEAEMFHNAQVLSEKNRFGLYGSEVACCPLCGSINLWEGEINGVKVNHFTLHSLNWTMMCRYDLKETRRGADAHRHFLEEHSEQISLENPLRARSPFLLIGLSESKELQAQIRCCDNSRSLLGLDKI